MLSRRSLLIALAASVTAPTLAREDARIDPRKFGATGIGDPKDGLAIQKAIDSAQPGQSVFLSPGIYELGDTQLLLRSRIPVQGSGQSTVLRKTTSATAYTSPFFNTVGVEGASVSSITFDASLLPSTRQYAIIVRSSPDAATREFSISRCQFRNCGVFIERNNRDVHVMDNSFIGSSNIGSQNGAINGVATGGIIDPQSGKTLNIDGAIVGVYIERNHFENIRTEAIDLNWDTRKVRIANNTIQNCDMTSTEMTNFHIDIGGASCSDIEVIGNSIIKDQVYGARSTGGIQVKLGTKNVTIAQNVIRFRSEQQVRNVGIRVASGSTNINIHDNEIDGFGRSLAIVALDTHPRINGVTIARNRLLNARADGVLITNADDVSVKNNLIQSDVAVEQGIDVEKSKNVSIDANEILGFREKIRRRD